MTQSQAWRRFNQNHNKPVFRRPTWSRFREIYIKKRNLVITFFLTKICYIYDSGLAFLLFPQLSRFLGFRSSLHFWFLQDSILSGFIANFASIRSIASHQSLWSASSLGSLSSFCSSIKGLSVWFCCFDMVFRESFVFRGKNLWWEILLLLLLLHCSLD